MLAQLLTLFLSITAQPDLRRQEAVFPVFTDVDTQGACETAVFRHFRLHVGLAALGLGREVFFEQNAWEVWAYDHIYGKLSSIDVVQTGPNTFEFGCVFRYWTGRVRNPYETVRTRYRMRCNQRDTVDGWVTTYGRIVDGLGICDLVRPAPGFSVVSPAEDSADRERDVARDRGLGAGSSNPLNTVQQVVGCLDLFDAAKAA